MINLINLGYFSSTSNIPLNFEGRKSHHVRKKPNNIKSITNRMSLHRDAHKLKQPKLVKINVEKFDNIYQDDDFYLPEGYHDISCDSVIAFISTGENIESPYMYLREENGKLKISCIDGRHRYRVLKDMGMRVMPITMSHDSERLAKKHGLLAVDIRA